MDERKKWKDLIGCLFLSCPRRGFSLFEAAVGGKSLAKGFGLPRALLACTIIFWGLSRDWRDGRDPHVVGEIRGRDRWERCQVDLDEVGVRLRRMGGEENTRERWGGCQIKICLAGLGVG